MARSILSALEARRHAANTVVYLLWVRETEATSFMVPGWQRLEPPRDGAVLFLHRKRQQGFISSAAGEERAATQSF
jgi:hypothetical protein